MWIEHEIEKILCGSRHSTLIIGGFQYSLREYYESAYALQCVFTIRSARDTLDALHYLPLGYGMGTLGV